MSCPCFSCSLGIQAAHLCDFDTVLSEQMAALIDMVLDLILTNINFMENVAKIYVSHETLNVENR